MRETGDEISKSLDHLIPTFGRLEVFTRFAVALFDAFDPKAQRSRRRNRLPPDHIPASQKRCLNNVNSNQTSS